MITPAISVMSAIEGLEIIAPQLDTWIVPISIIVLTLLFVIQKHGTGMVGKLFAPIMLIWFLLLAVLGARSIYANPEVLQALNPYWAVHFFLQYKTVSFIALGAVVLSITGVEALYADMGHFGKLPIRVAWFSVVLPSLVLNYFGQGALLLKHPEAIKNPFFLLAPEWALIPMLIIATLATVIASQAVISGVFSLTRQAVRLGYLSPMRIIHTSEMDCLRRLATVVPGDGHVYGDDDLEERAFPPAAPDARAWQLAGSDDLFAGEVTASACAGYCGVYVPRPERDPVCPAA